MAAGSLLTQINPSDLFRETSVGYNLPSQSALYQTANGASRGLSMPKLIAAQLIEYYNGIWTLPTLVAVGTGLTHKLILTDDGTDASDLGKVVRIGITPYNLSTALSVFDFSLAASKGTETFANITLGATTGLPVVGSIAIVAANLASLAAGNIYGIRIRRVGDNAADTCNGRVLLMGGVITDT
jgi:hypothetical protein